MDIQEYSERLKNSISADNFLSLLLAEKTLEHHDVDVAFRSMPSERKFDFLLKTLQDKFKDKPEALSAILESYCRLNNSVFRTATIKSCSS